MKAETLCAGHNRSLEVADATDLRVSRSQRSLRIRSILVPTDFSPGAQQALEYAAAFAAEVGATITLLHVIEPLGSPDLEYFPLIVEPRKLVALAREQLSAAPRDHDLDAALFTRPVVRTGIAFFEITEVARDRSIDLVILSAHEFAGLEHVWLGSTAERVVRHAPCPVLVLGKSANWVPGRIGIPDRRDSRRLRRILVPVDFSDPAKGALRRAARLADYFGAAVHLVYVIESLRKLRHAGTVPSDTDTSHAREALRERLAELANSEIPELIPVHHTVRIGHPVREIIACAEEESADMIVIATHGRGGFRRALLGSVAERVVREAECPVMVVANKPDFGRRLNAFES